jgi:antitoxin component YwqK of YwqJK toxin-antitoxin module
MLWLEDRTAPMIAQSFSFVLFAKRSRRSMRAGLLGVLVSIASQCAAVATGSRVIQEWYPNGGLRSECEVNVDADGNVVNDGAWRKWNLAGTLIADGHYQNGKQSGEWVRWFNRDEADTLFTAPFDQFESPFVSGATFVEGQMHGEWTIADAQGRTCSRVTLKNGERNGAATLWLPDGRVFREAHFSNALPSGELRGLGPDGNLTTIATYAEGRQVVNNVTYFPGSVDKRIESTCQTAVVTLRASDDYMRLRFAQYAVSSKFARHGEWRSWYSNGQLQCVGNYENDRETGMFTWWHANAAPAVTGHVVDGQPNGVWIWWYANGQRAAKAQFDRAAVAPEQPPIEQSRESPISASFTPKGRTAVTRKIRQLY